MASARTPREGKKAAAGTAAAAAQGYSDSKSHVHQHLERIELLVKAQTVRWRNTIAADKPESLWGMVHVTDAEVNAFLHADPLANGDLPAAAAKAVAEYQGGAAALGASIAAREAGTPAETKLRLRWLQQVFDLSDFERDILVVCLLPEQDARYRRIYGYLQDDASRTQPTVELVAAILSSDGNGLNAIRRCFDEERPLAAFRLLVVRHHSEEPLPVRSIRVDGRIIDFLMDSDVLDGRLRHLVEIAAALDWSDFIADPHHVERMRRIAEWWQHQSPAQGVAIFLRGVYGSGRSASARVLASAIGMRLLKVDLGRLGQSPVAWDETVFLAFRDARLLGAAIYWAGCEALLTRDQPSSRWDDLMSQSEEFPGLVIFGSQTSWESGSHFRKKTFLHMEMGMPSYPLRRQLWNAHLPAAQAFSEPAPDPNTLGDALATRFQITEGQILDAIRTAQGYALLRNAGGELLTAEDLFEGCRRQASRRLLTFSRRIEPRLHLAFSDLVLPDANLRQLREVQDRIRSLQRVHSELGFENRLRLSHGLVVLFTGGSGTGKTMAAEWLAREVGVDLYKADLSAVVSKWVGETEKNLHSLFAESEDSSAIIFFDEADALFGKRGEVKDARDRWANAEVNYLLQKIEEYPGVVILASNLRQNIDDAFMRRIGAMVDFPAPDDAAREKIWQGMFPPDLKHPSDEEMHGLSARIKLSGGSIRNIVIEAAFRAAATTPEGEPVVTLRHLVAASAREYQKLGKPLTKTEFGDVFYRWVEEDVL